MPNPGVAVTPEIVAETAATQPTSGDRVSGRRRIVLVNVLRVVILFAVLGLWQLASAKSWINPLYFPKPTEVAQALWDGIKSGDLLGPLKTTLIETLVGFGISAVAGVLIGIVLYSIPLLADTLRPFITALNNLPRIALAPLFVLLFGVGSTSRIALVISLSFFIILIDTMAGMQQANRDYLLLARSLGASRAKTFFTFVLPPAVPVIFAGLQLGLTYAFLGAVIGEILTGASGLGAVIEVAINQINTPTFYAALVLLVVVATALSTVMRLIERRLLFWHEVEIRGTQGGGGI